MGNKGNVQFSVHKYLAGTTEHCCQTGVQRVKDGEIGMSDRNENVFNPFNKDAIWRK